MKTVIVPDIKKAKKDLRYRLMSIKDLHLKFITDNEVQCSYQHFARQVPDNIIKPKPEDWCISKFIMWILQFFSHRSIFVRYTNYQNNLYHNIHFLNFSDKYIFIYKVK